MKTPINYRPIALSLALLSLGSVGPLKAAETYTIDPGHSSVSFTIRHVFTKLQGSFVKFEGKIVIDRDHMENSNVDATVEVASIDSHSEQRDSTLKRRSFFDAGAHPLMTFSGKSWKKTGPDSYDVAGDLTIKGKTQPIVMKVTSLGFGPGLNGKPVSGWEAVTTLNRRDFGVNGPAYLDKAIGDEVVVSIEVEADLQSPNRHKEIALDAKSLEGFPGRYQVAHLIVTVTQSGDQLYAQATGQDKFELFAEGPESFFAKVTELTMVFRPDAQGKATEFVLHQGGMEMHAQRIE